MENNMMTQSTRQCLDCGEIIKGRSDKKFCDDQCRNNYNNKQNTLYNEVVKDVNNILKRNRKILECLTPTEGLIKINKSKLIEKGFLWSYHTHSLTTHEGLNYSFCYEFGFLSIENNFALLFKRLDDSLPNINDVD